MKISLPNIIVSKASNQDQRESKNPNSFHASYLLDFDLKRIASLKSAETSAQKNCPEFKREK